MAAIIESRDLTRIYGRAKPGAAPVLAVDHVSFAVHAGEVFGFLGPNRAGRTTTIRLCTGIIKPTSGHVLIAGPDVAEHAIRAKEHIGVVSHAASLYAEMTVSATSILWPGCTICSEQSVSRESSNCCRIPAQYDRRLGASILFQGMKCIRREEVLRDK
jgi:ABC-2 type transport system ATP-binding protein